MTWKLIYLDYASTHPRNTVVMDRREQFEKTSYANVGRWNYDLAEQAMIAYADSKKAVADWIGCEPVEVLYTYSATYALNLLALALEHNQVLKRGDTILLSVSEHHANIVPWQMLAERIGAQVKFVELNTNYCIDLEDLRKQLDDSVKVVSLQYVSNVTGAVHPLQEVRKIIGSDRLFFVDAAQMALHGPFSMRDIWCDAMVLSGHKMMADTGIGVLALWKVLQKSWQSPVSGGGAVNSVRIDGYEQAGIPDKWEPGTPHITGAVTLSAAIEQLTSIDEEKRENYKHLIQFADERFHALSDKGVKVFHSQGNNVLGVWSFIIEGKHASDVADALAQEQICVRSGHHCCEPLHGYLGVQGTVRISIGYDTTESELEIFFRTLESLL